MNRHALMLGLQILLLALVALTDGGAGIDSQGADVSGARNEVAVVVIGERGSA